MSKNLFQALFKENASLAPHLRQEIDKISQTALQNALFYLNKKDRVAFIDAIVTLAAKADTKHERSMLYTYAANTPFVVAYDKKCFGKSKKSLHDRLIELRNNELVRAFPSHSANMGRFFESQAARPVSVNYQANLEADLKDLVTQEIFSKVVRPIHIIDGQTVLGHAMDESSAESLMEVGAGEGLCPKSRLTFRSYMADLHLTQIAIAYREWMEANNGPIVACS